MSAAKLLLSLPDDLLTRFRSLMPNRKRSEVIRHLIEEEVIKREKNRFYEELSG